MAEKKGLVISGGGARGAWACGALRYLIKEQGCRYHIVAGTSTGSLIAPLAALGDIDGLIDNYTTITPQETLGSRFLGSRSILVNAICALVGKKDSVFTTKPLHHAILTKHLTEQRWAELAQPSQAAEAWVSTVDMQKAEVRYFGTKDPGMTREKFASAMLASCSIPFFMSRARIIGEPNWFVDGGVMDTVPIGQVIREGAREVTVITLGHEVLIHTRDYSTLPEVVLREIELGLQETFDSDIAQGEMITRELDWRARLKNRLRQYCRESDLDESFRLTSSEDEPLGSESGEFATVRFKILAPKTEIGPTMDFTPEVMKRYVEEGYAFARDPANWKCIPVPWKLT